MRIKTKNDCRAFPAAELRGQLMAASSLFSPSQPPLPHTLPSLAVRALFRWPALVPGSQPQAEWAAPSTLGKEVSAS